MGLDIRKGFAGKTLPDHKLPLCADGRRGRAHIIILQECAEETLLGSLRSYLANIGGPESDLKNWKAAQQNGMGESEIQYMEDYGQKMNHAIRIYRATSNRKCKAYAGQSGTYRNMGYSVRSY